MEKNETHDQVEEVENPQDTVDLNLQMFLGQKQDKQQQQSNMMMNMSRFYQPAFLQLDQYDSIEEIRQKFYPMRNLNLKLQIENFKNATFFIIRSKKFDDVHKSLKYGVWTSSAYNNKKFNRAFMQNGGEVYFLFTCLTCDFFVGMAKMVHLIDQSREFAYWGEIGKWRGLCQVDWIFLRDVGFNMTVELEENGDQLH